ncbi:MAG: ABC transporter substrate-binding protein [Sulfurimonas sp.]
MLSKKVIPLLLALSLLLHSKTIKEEPKKVFGSSPSINYLVYAINPEKMVGLNFDAKNRNNSADKNYLSKAFLALPVIGTFHSTGAGMSVESIKKYDPDLILIWEDDYIHTKVSQQIAKTKIPTLTLPFRKIESMAPSILLAAEAMGEKERGELLSTYAKERMAYVKRTLKGVKSTRYYYAEGADGLATECSDSFHVEALNYAGGENVHQCTQSNLRGLERITFERLLEYKPEVIVAQNRVVYHEIISNPIWQHLEAVKKRRVYLVPNQPFHWIDRPPSFMRIIGIEWLAHHFHPEVYKVDIYTQTKKFYKLFLGVKLRNEDIQQILGGEQ